MDPIVYRDGVLLAAADPGGGYRAIRYAINLPGAAPEAALVLGQDQARELHAALGWLIAQVDAKHGRASFRPREARSMDPRPGDRRVSKIGPDSPE